MKTPEELGITLEQYINIAKLTIFVRDSVPPPKFNIGKFHSRAIDPFRATYECGTSACFCGYGPLAGIAPIVAESWNAYSSRAFGGIAYALLFDDAHVNSKEAAVRRGAWLLENGRPSSTVFEWRWEAPTSYEPDWTAIEFIAQAPIN